VYIVLPVSVLLFAGGVGFCCVVTPAAFGFLIRFNVELGGGARFILSSYLRFFMRLLLVFGLAFQTPLVLSRDPGPMLHPGPLPGPAIVVGGYLACLCASPPQSASAPQSASDPMPAAIAISRRAGYWRRIARR
jgi:hypothetical protein